jgi:xyloglucan-specific exo-beta-1,4-glucanase
MKPFGQTTQYFVMIKTIIAILILSAVLGGHPAHAAYTWKSVTIGGGGYVTGIIPHPGQQNLIYIRTDVSGAFRWNAAVNNWIPLTDSFTSDQDFGIESLAIDPNNVNTVYMAVGNYAESWGPRPGVIYKSTNQGATWSVISPAWTVKCGANDDRRWCGERLVVDPFNSSIILFGTRNDGLWKSTNGGSTWAQASFPGVLTAMYGIESIVFDRGTSGIVYASAHGDAVYKSTDHGVTWTKINGPASVGRLKVAGGVLWASTSSGVSKYSGGVWTNYLPSGGASDFSGISINPSNSSDILAAQTTSSNPVVYRSTNGGGTWTAQSRTITSAGGWFTSYMLTTPAMSAIEFDPFTSGRAWLSDWYATYHTDNVNASPVAWANNEKGREALVSLALCAPPTGVVLLSGHADCDGFRHGAGLDSFPTTFAQYQDTHSIDYYPGNSNNLVRVAFDRWRAYGAVLTSTNNGASWTDVTGWANTTDSMPMRVAVSATSASNFVVCNNGGSTKYTTNNGANWASSTGLPTFPNNNWSVHQPLAADRVTGGVFYYYGAGKFYKSTNSGASFSIVNSTLPSSGYPMVRAVPGVAGEIFLGLDTSGLYRSTNSGTSWTQIGGVTKAHMLAVGKPATGSTVPALYIYGRLTGDTTDKIYQSLDRGATWTNIQDPSNPVGCVPSLMEASQQTFGLVFIATGGHGIFYGTPGASAPPAPTGLTATAGNAQVALSWAASSGATSYNVLRSTVSGSGYATVTTGVATTSYTNTGLTNGTAYYFVVQAVSSGGTSGNSNQASATPAAAVPQAQIAVGTAAIDGTVEAAWSAATSYSLGKTTGTVSGASDCSASYKALWDSTNLYVLIDVTDNTKINESVNAWDDDSVELYLDGGNNKTTAYDANDRQYVYGWGDATVIEGGGRSTTGVTFAKADPTSTTYRIETKIPWSTLGVTAAANNLIGIDVHVDDDDDNGARDGKVIWNDGTDQAWTNPSLFGTGKLNAAPASGNTHTGTWACKAVMTSTISFTNCAQVINVPTNTNYVASLWIKGSGAVQLKVVNISWATTLAQMQCNATGTWQQYTLPSFNTGTNTQIVYVLQDQYGIAGTAYVDDCFLGPSGGANLMTNTGFESGGTSWTTNGVFTIVQNP